MTIEIWREAAKNNGTVKNVAKLLPYTCRKVLAALQQI
jgi:hypothetical protein